MKTKLFLLIAALGCFVFGANAQKFGYVDTEYILGNMTEYKAAQKQLNELSGKWEADLKILKEEVSFLLFQHPLVQEKQLLLLT
jgi:outer membrane protein